MQPIIRFELVEDLTAVPGQTVKVVVARSIVGTIDGDDTKPGYVTDAWGVFQGQAGGPGVRGDVGYAVWMADEQRFEVLNLV